MAAPAAGPDPRTGAPDPDYFRKVVGRFATGVTVVTTRAQGVDHAMTANAFTSVSLEPLLVLVCVEKEARFHDAVVESGFWGVSVLEESARATSTWFATRGRPLHGQMDRHAHFPGPVTGAPLMAASIATLECLTRDVHDGGDHDIVVGEVVSASTPSPDGRPLLWYRARYHTVGER